MFGTNPKLGQKYFENDKLDTLRVTSTFPTLQGEGIFSGQRAVFLRLSQCNLACSGCDTFFTDETVMQFEELRDDLALSAQTWLAKNTDYTFYETDTKILNSWLLVITGGEPTLQKNIWEFVRRTFEGYSPRPLFKHVQMESNGLLPIPDWVKADFEYDFTLVISPKCNEGASTKYLKPHKNNLRDADCLKFVVSANPDSSYHTIPDWALDWQQEYRRPIYFSPWAVYNSEPQQAIMARKQGKQADISVRSEDFERVGFFEPGLFNMDACRANMEYAGLLAMKYDGRLSLQTHLLVNLP